MICARFQALIALLKDRLKIKNGLLKIQGLFYTCETPFYIIILLHFRHQYQSTIKNQRQSNFNLFFLYQLRQMVEAH